MDKIDSPATSANAEDKSREIRNAYYQYYTQMSEKLIKEIPMNTIEKSRYSTGDKLDLQSSNSRPPPRGWGTVNAWRFANIATRVSQLGNYSEVEEELEARREREMVRPSFQYGRQVNPMAQMDSVNYEELRRNQLRAARALRAESICGDSTIFSGKWIIREKFPFIVIILKY